MFKSNKIVTLILSIAMVFSLVSITASANEVEVVHDHDTIITNNDFVQPRYSPCPGGGKHKMTGRGVAWIYSGSYQSPGTLQVYGFANQCTQCYLVVGSEGNPHNSGVLGKYALRSYNSNVSNNGVAIYGGVDGSYYGNMLEDSFWVGFEW